VTGGPVSAGAERPPRLLLVGMMGAGKSTVGGLVARRLGWAFVDSDALVEEETGTTVAALFAERGEASFRRTESAVLRRVLDSEVPVVVSMGGGAVLDPANRALLRGSGTVVWLRAEPATLASRVGRGAGRPLLGRHPASALEHLDAARRPLYLEVADRVVDVDGLTPEEVAEAVLALAGPVACRRPGSRPPAQGTARRGRP